jgi:hypothetical protein
MSWPGFVIFSENSVIFIPGVKLRWQTGVR